MVMTQARRVNDSSNLAWEDKGKRCSSVSRIPFQVRHPRLPSDEGNKGAWVLRRMESDVAHFITLSFWESREAIAAFAGADIEVAKYYPEDEKYLLEFEQTVTHYELF